MEKVRNRNAERDRGREGAWHETCLTMYDTGNVLEYGTPAFNEIITSQGVKTIPGTRSIILVDIDQVGTSCGFSVPKYDFVEFRPTLHDFFEKRVANEEAGKREDGIER